MINGTATPVTSTPTHPIESTPDPRSSTKADTSSNSKQDVDMVTIKRTYNFAGKVHNEEKIVPADSAEAKLHLSTNPSASPQPPTSPTRLRRPPKKLKRSQFEPHLEPMPPPRTDLNFGISKRTYVEADPKKSAAAKKLNTVEKSKMDWAGFVDKEGIRDELVTAGKAKEGYLGRQDFLARVDQKKEEERRAARGLPV
jgi:hypothetical protein